MPSDEAPPTTLETDLRRLGLNRTADDLNDLIAEATRKRWSATVLLEHIVAAELEDRQHLRADGGGGASGFGLEIQMSADAVTSTDAASAVGFGGRWHLAGGRRQAHREPVDPVPVGLYVVGSLYFETYLAMAAVTISWCRRSVSAAMRRSCRWSSPEIRMFIDFDLSLGLGGTAFGVSATERGWLSAGVAGTGAGAGAGDGGWGRSSPISSWWSRLNPFDMEARVVFMLLSRRLLECCRRSVAIQRAV